MNPALLALLAARRAASTFSPADISGLDLWLRADAITGLSDGAAVASWPDSSSMGNHATQGTADRRPLYRTGQVNGLPAVQFDGANDFLVSNCPVVGAQTRFFVLSVGGGGTYGLWYGASAPAALNNYVVGRLLHSWTGSVETPVASAPVPSSGFAVVAVRYSDATGTYSARLNGTGVAGGAYATNTAGNSQSILGAGSLTGTYPLLGSMAEVIHYPSYLSDVDVARVESYLMTKWGIA